jgi:hypothetical protein
MGTGEFLQCLMLSSFLQRFNISIWAGTINDCLIEPYLIATCLSGIQYAEFLERTCLFVLEVVLVILDEGIWFQQDDAPPRFS